MKILRYILPLLILAGACTREPLYERELPPAPEGFKTVHYAATATGAVAVKADLSEDSYVFEAGDRLYVSHVVVKGAVRDTALYGYMTLASGAGTATARFEGDLYCSDSLSLSSSTTIDITLVSAADSIHTVRDGKLISTTYPDNEFSADLEAAIRSYSHFTCSTTFGNHRITLSQQSTFLKFNLRTNSEDLPASTGVLVGLYNDGEPDPIWESTVTAATAGRLAFVTTLGGGTELSSAELCMDWTDALSTPHSKTYSDITDHALAANHFYTISRSDIVFTGFRIKAKYDDTHVTFKYTSNVEYSTDDGETWDFYTGGTIDLDADEQVCFKGTLADCNCAGNTQLFTADQLCYIAGKINSLLADTTTLATNAFRGAFSRKNTTDSGKNGSDEEKPTAITVSPSNSGDYVDWVDINPTDPLILPVTTAANCYMDMFLGCISLTWAPNLPATTLADKCYFRMFHSCFGLTSIPSLPSAVTMAGSSTRRRYCYQMFQSCTAIDSLKVSLFGGTATLQRGCFEDMFAHCTGLVYVDTLLLPATTLAADCYRGMFQDTRFQRAPDLLVGTLVSECYRYMFNECRNLNYIKCLATTNLGNTYTSNWVSGTVPNTSSCKFVKAASASWPSGANGILGNWTQVNYTAP